MSAAVEMSVEASGFSSFRRSLTARDRRSLAGMAGFIVLLHAVGFGVLFELIAPRQLTLGGDHPVFTAGVGIPAYTFGLRHAFDADHIAAVDNGHPQPGCSCGSWASSTWSSCSA